MLERGQTVRDRPRPDYDPNGIRLGAFNLFPELIFDIAYDDNIRAVEKDSDVYWDDTIFVIVPELALESDWTRHELGGGARARVVRYDEYDFQDFTDYEFWVDGRLDMRDSWLSAAVNLDRLNEPFSSPNIRQDALAPTQYADDSIELVYRFAPSRLFLQAELELTQLDFDDDTVVVFDLAGNPVGTDKESNDDRDRDITDFRLRGGYRVTPSTGMFLQGRVYDFDYKTDLDRFGNENRDQNGYDAVVGAELDFSGVTFGEVYAGYRNIDFESDDYQQQDGPLIGAEVNWNVTQLTTITLGADQQLRGTTVEGSSGIEALALSVDVDHELLRNVMLTLELSGTREDFLNTDNGRKDDIYRFRLGAEYAITRNWGLNGGYTYLKRESNDDTVRQFDINRIYFGLVGRI